MKLKSIKRSKHVAFSILFSIESRMVSILNEFIVCATPALDCKKYEAMRGMLWIFRMVAINKPQWISSWSKGNDKPYTWSVTSNVYSLASHMCMHFAFQLSPANTAAAIFVEAMLTLAHRNIDHPAISGFFAQGFSITNTIGVCIHCAWHQRSGLND